MNFSPKVNLEMRFFCALTLNYAHLTYHVTKEKKKKVCKLVENLVCLNILAFLMEGEHTPLFTSGMNGCNVYNKSF